MERAGASALGKGTPATSSNDAEVIRLWLSSYCRQTRLAYEQSWRLWLIHVGAPIASICPATLSTYQDTLLAESYKPATVALRVMGILSLIRYAANMHYLPGNPAHMFRPLRISRTLAGRILSQSEVQALIAAATPGRNRTLVQFLYYTGCRVSEAVSLRWRQITQYESGAWDVEVVGKGNKARTVHLLPQMQWLYVELEHLTPNHRASDPVFRSSHRGTICTVTAQNIVKAAAREAGINKRVSPHWLRHAMAQHSVQNGCPLNILQQTLGHASLATTQIYLETGNNCSAAHYLPDFR